MESNESPLPDPPAKPQAEGGGSPPKETIPPEGPRSPSDTFWILGLFLLACAARVIAALQTRVIAPDGVEYVRLATAFGTGDAQTALSHPHHPLYPFLVSLARFVMGDGTSAASFVSVLFGALAVIPLFLLLRATCGRAASRFAGFLYVFLPPFVRFGADAISEATFHFFLLSALALGTWHLARPGRFASMGLAGVAAACAYLTRPEGIALPLAIVGTLLFRAIRKRSEAKTALLASGILLLAFTAVAMPYLLHIRAETGRFALTMKKPLGHFL
ncbi:MAG: ArnT family glycosyltransferase, partial [Planctomycetota bacterium]